MKILHITKKYPNALGGDTVVVSSLQAQHEAAGHRVAILTSNCKEIKRGEHIYKFGLRDTSTELDRITMKRLISLVGLFFKTFAVLRRERPDVVHAHSVDMAFFASFAARFFSVPMIHTFHIVTFYDKNQSALRRKTELWFAKAAALRVITAPNIHDAAALNRAGLRQTVVLPNGVDLKFWRPDPHAVKSREFVFVSFGRLETQKGYEYLIKAVSLLKAMAGQRFRVVIAGEGSQKESLQKLARLYGVSDIVAFAGRKTPTEVRALLSQADAAIFTSLYETTPLTLLEAWAIGLPVITTVVGILQGASLNTSMAYMVRPGDELSLMGAMQSCMTDDALRAKVAAAGHKEVKKYAWLGIAQRTEKIYRSVL